MKHNMRWMLALALLLIVLAGCTTSADTTGSTAIPNDKAALSDEMRLIIGTLKLEGGDLALTPDQATTLLPLWKAYVALSESDGVAAAEVASVANQIREGMTEEQLAAIAALELAAGSTFEMVTELGLTTTADHETGEQIAGTGPGGGMGGGSGVPGSGPGGGDVTSLSPEQIAELQAERQASGGNRSGILLATEIVNLLRARAH